MNLWGNPFMQRVGGSEYNFFLGGTEREESWNGLTASLAELKGVWW